MYIPINFLASSLSCANVEISGSTIPDGVEFNIIGSGSDDAQLEILVPVNSSLTFNITGGSTSNAKLLLVGGGGVGGDLGLGGGGAGEVIFQDVTLEPGITYFISSSAFGGNSTNPNGGSSTFIENYVSDPVNWRQYIAQGGDGDDTNNDGGTSGNGFVGGSGNAGAGGGGGGSTSIGLDATRITNVDYGGDGGSGSIIPYPYDSVVDSGNAIAGGGPGTTNTPAYNGSYAQGVSPFAYGNGGSDGDGRAGVSCIWIPIKDCSEIPTGSIILPNTESFEAIGGDIVGTFTSSSIDYKYHIFKNDGFFNTISGSKSEAKVVIVAGGGRGGGEGGGGAGMVTIKRNLTLYGTYECEVGNSGSAGQRAPASTLTSLSNYLLSPQLVSVGGGAGANNITDGVDGGSGGGGYGDTLRVPGESIGGTLGSIFYGNDGGAGSGSGAETFYGGGGGGAGSAGQKGGPGPDNGYGGTGYNLNEEFFPQGVLFSDQTIAVGGNARFKSGSNPEPYSGGGGHADFDEGAKGFICITYPI